MRSLRLTHAWEAFRAFYTERHKAPIFLAGVALVLTLLAGCRDAPGAAAALVTETSVAPTATELRPPLVSAVPATPTSLPSFELPLEEERQATPTPDVVTTPTLEATEVAEGAPTEAADSGPDDEKPTPGPTFTLPAQPTASANEHYWFRRPVPQGDGLWTDKYYPYGSTRGGQLRAHHGVEFNVAYDTPVLAAADGTVRVAGSDSATTYGPHPTFYGNLVVIEHGFQFRGQPVFTLYGHLNEVSVAVGQQVSAQDAIGLSGATGVADGPHVHFEVRVGANDYASTRNPLLWLYPFPDRGTVAGRVVWSSGALAQEAPVSLNRMDGPSPYYATTTYADDSVNPDEGWNENFAIDDVVAGYYEVTVRAGDEKYTALTWVHPYQTSFVEIILP